MTYIHTIILNRLRIAILCLALIGLGLPTTVMAHDMMSPEMSVAMSQDTTLDSHCDGEETAQDNSEKSCCASGDCDTSCMGLSATLVPVLDLSVHKGQQSLENAFINHLIPVLLTSDLPPPQA